MITTDNMYTAYNHNICVEILSINEELKKLNDSLVYITSFLNELKIKITESPLFSHYKAMFNSYSITKSNIDKRIAQITKRKEELLASKVSIEEYKFIVRTFNKLITKRIIETGYKLKIGNLGAIRIRSDRKVDSVKRRINWGISNKNKELIEQRGGIPFKATYEIIDGKKTKVGDNGGEKWLIKHTNPYEIFWCWDKRGSNLLNQSLYKLNFTKHMKLAINTAAKNDPSIFTRFI